MTFSIFLKDILSEAASLLGECAVFQPRREAERLIADILEMKPLDLYLHFSRLISRWELDRIRYALQRRGKREPLAYISGKIEFAGSVFSVSESVLIPRPETEILVEKITQTLKEIDCRGKILWDLCSGSGCIGISLKRRFPELHVVCSDLSFSALEIAKSNAKGLSIEFKQGDLFEPFKDNFCDFFVCNPPYVSESEYKDLSPEVLFEPKEALVSGNSGLEFYERIAKELKNYLIMDGRGWLEIGAGQREKVKNIFKSENWRCFVESDWAGHDRFCFLH